MSFPQQYADISTKRVTDLYTNDSLSDDDRRSILSELWQYIILETKKLIQYFPHNVHVRILGRKYCSWIDTLSTSNPSDIMDYNVRAFITVVVITKIIQFTNYTDDTSMKQYFQDIKIDKIFDKYYDIFDNYDLVVKTLMTDYNFKSILGVSKYHDDGYGFVPYTVSDMKKTLIICLGGSFNIEDIITSYVHEVYYAGIVTSMEYADGKLLTPFEFIHHDITHMHNRGVHDDYDIKAQHKFWSYLKTCDLDEDTKHRVNIIFFTLIHESMSSWFLSDDGFRNKHFDDINPYFVTNIFNWSDVNMFGGLLPQDILNKGYHAISQYLNESFELLKTHFELSILYEPPKKNILNKVKH